MMRFRKRATASAALCRTTREPCPKLRGLSQSGCWVDLGVSFAIASAAGPRVAYFAIENRQNRQHRQRRCYRWVAGPRLGLGEVGLAIADGADLLTVLTVVRIRFSRDARIRIIRVPARPSRLYKSFRSPTLEGAFARDGDGQQRPEAISASPRRSRLRWDGCLPQEAAQK